MATAYLIGTFRDTQRYQYALGTIHGRIVFDPSTWPTYTSGRRLVPAQPRTRIHDCVAACCIHSPRLAGCGCVSLAIALDDPSRCVPALPVRDQTQHASVLMPGPRRSAAAALHLVVELVLSPPAPLRTASLHAPLALAGPWRAARPLARVIAVDSPGGVRSRARVRRRRFPVIPPSSASVRSCEPCALRRRACRHVAPLVRRRAAAPHR